MLMVNMFTFYHRTPVFMLSFFLPLKSRGILYYKVMGL